jgi:hypothetical protein
MANPLAETYLNEANKLDGSNFINWKFKMQTLMEGYGVWNIANGTELKPVAAAGATGRRCDNSGRRCDSSTDPRLGEARKQGKGIVAHVR